MLGFAGRAFRKHPVGSIVAGIAFLFAGDYAVSVLFAPERAVMYDARMSMYECWFEGAEPGRECFGHYAFLIGNTGEHDERIVAIWPVNIGNWTRQQRLHNISADEPRPHDPELHCSTAEDRSECVIDHLAPGTMLTLNLSCSACSSVDIAELSGAELQLLTEARQFRGDPRVNALFRRLQFLLY